MKGKNKQTRPYFRGCVAHKLRAMMFTPRERRVLFESAPLSYLFLPPYTYDTLTAPTNNCIISLKKFLSITIKKNEIKRKKM